MQLDQAFWKRYWIPVFALGAMAVVCGTFKLGNHRAIADLFSNLFNKLYIAASVLFLVAAAVRRKSWRTIAWAIELSLLSLVLTNVLKIVVPLGRPPHIKHGVVVPGGYSPGFPSAHTAFAFGLAWFVFEIKPRYSLLWFAFAIAIGWSRLETRSHYPFQVICGALLGIAMGYFISRATTRFLPWLQQRWSTPGGGKSLPEVNSDQGHADIQNLDSGDNSFPLSAKQL